VNETYLNNTAWQIYDAGGVVRAAGARNTDDGCMREFCPLCAASALDN
jgi:hypothetical protein